MHCGCIVLNQEGCLPRLFDEKELSLSCEASPINVQRLGTAVVPPHNTTVIAYVL